MSAVGFIENPDWLFVINVTGFFLLEIIFKNDNLVAAVGFVEKPLNDINFLVLLLPTFFFLKLF